jgi:acyl phosphate:glycerol-3-phosphate acyltransferase
MVTPMSTTTLLNALVVVVVSYLIGSIPTGYLLARARGVNIFEVGSGNMGATNMVRIGGMGMGLITWFLDSAKGIVAVLVATTFLMPDEKILATVLAGFCAIVGHNWSLFIGLLTGTIRGGKGAATAFGTMIVIAPVYVIAVMLLIGGFIVARTRLVSLAVLVMFSLGAIVMTLVVVLGLDATPWQYTVCTLAILGIVVYRFRENIQRLVRGTERRLGDSA